MKCHKCVEKDKIITQLKQRIAELEAKLARPNNGRPMKEIVSAKTEAQRRWREKKRAHNAEFTRRHCSRKDN